MCREVISEILHSHVTDRNSEILSFVIIIRKTHIDRFIIDSFIKMCDVSISYACTLTVQVFICTYIFMAMYSFVTRLIEATFCGMPLRAFEKFGCTAGEKYLRKTALD